MKYLLLLLLLSCGCTTQSYYYEVTLPSGEVVNCDIYYSYSGDPVVYVEDCTNGQEYVILSGVTSYKKVYKELSDVD